MCQHRRLKSTCVAQTYRADAVRPGWDNDKLDVVVCVWCLDCGLNWTVSGCEAVRREVIPSDITPEEEH
jgi:hypothetical protein